MTIVEAELAVRLRRAREAAGITQEAAAAAIGVSRPAIGQIEKGRRSVSGIELDRLASLYGTGLGELLATSDTAPIVMFRKDGFADMPNVGNALDEVLRIGRELTSLERSLGIERAALGTVAYDVAPPSSIHQAVLQGAQTADAERRRHGLGDEPIADMVELLEANGFRTAILDMPDSVSGVMLADPDAGTLVAVNRRDHLSRRVFSFGHEYGHAMLDRAGGVLVSRTDEHNDLREIRANAFAANLLMPSGGIRRRLGELGKRQTQVAPTGSFQTASATTPNRNANAVELHDVAILAHAFGVSRFAMLHRLRSLRILSPTRFEGLRGRDVASGAKVARLLDLSEPDHAAERHRFNLRYARLALEAHTRGIFGRPELWEHLTRNAGMGSQQANEFIAALAEEDASPQATRRQKQSR